MSDLVAARYNQRLSEALAKALPAVKRAEADLVEFGRALGAVARAAQQVKAKLVI